MNKIKLGIIIINFNGDPYILDCLNSIQLSFLRYAKDTSEVKDLRHLRGGGKKVVVVDNNSSDNSTSLIKKNYPEVKLIKNRKNLGFAKAVNREIKFCLKNKFNAVLLLNPDTIVTKNFLNPLTKILFSDPKIGIVASVLKGKEGPHTIYALGSKFNLILGRTEHIHFRKIFPPPRSPSATSEVFFEQEMVSGCCMLIKKEVFEKIGLFDERFFLYFEDNDFCLRAWKAGFRILVEPRSIVTHLGGQSVGGLSLKKIAYIIKGNILFDLKWVKFWWWPVSFGYLVVLGVKMFMDWLSLQLKSFTSEVKD